MWQETQLSSVNPAQLSDCNSRHMASLLLLQLASVSFCPASSASGTGCKIPCTSTRMEQKKAAENITCESARCGFTVVQQDSQHGSCDLPSVTSISACGSVHALNRVWGLERARPVRQRKVGRWQ